ncbi:sperm axonemal maintenance protein CFAP97D1 [Amia ocellicauda]|uniref:sperm axonemal maintenance protein CFAP97D1 n=1 Tax=Amia ocellicauda TaxID=2972642 RepID=UPI0034643E8A
MSPVSRGESRAFVAWLRVLYLSCELLRSWHRTAQLKIAHNYCTSGRLGKESEGEPGVDPSLSASIVGVSLGTGLWDPVCRPGSSLQLQVDTAHYRAYPAIAGCPGQYTSLRRRKDTQHLKRHKTRVKNVAAVVDSTTPRAFPHIEKHLKDNRREKERLPERNLTIHKQKLQHIKTTRNSLDNWNDYQPKSLNSSRRKQEQHKITLENQVNQHKISTAWSPYSREEMAKQYEVSVGFYRLLRRKYLDPN